MKLNTYSALCFFNWKLQFESILAVRNVLQSAFYPEMIFKPSSYASIFSQTLAFYDIFSVSIKKAALLMPKTGPSHTFIHPQLPALHLTPGKPTRPPSLSGLFSSMTCAAALLLSLNVSLFDSLHLHLCVPWPEGTRGLGYKGIWVTQKSQMSKLHHILSW